MNKTTDRLEYLRQELREGTMSYEELAELQDLAGQIDPGDVELLEAAGVPEFNGHIIAVYDNPRYLDRYTFVTDNETRDGMYEMLGTDETGNGFSQWTTGSYSPRMKNKHLGTEVQFNSLPDSLKKHVWSRLED